MRETGDRNQFYCSVNHDCHIRATHIWSEHNSYAKKRFYILRDRHTDRHTDRQTDRQAR